jgi:pyrroloquinoline quinone biosynthesis protein B
MLRVIVLGAAAGGGVPQWNCNCQVCLAVRLGTDGAPLTQSSIAVSADGERWVLVNASPDIRQQFAQTPRLHPRGGTSRSSPMAAAVLTNADVDHVAGLLSLRESQAFPIYATGRVHGVLNANSIFNVLSRDLVARRTLKLELEQPVLDAWGSDTGVRLEAFTVPGKVALWLENPAEDNFGSVAEDTIGLALRKDGDGRRLFYLPGCAAITPELKARFAPCDTLLFDGTTFTECELVMRGVGEKSAARMGHLPMAGARGSMALLADVKLQRRLFIHINNTNPALLPDSPERAEIARRGWELACDGMEFDLV